MYCVVVGSNESDKSVKCPECRYDLRAADVVHGRFARCPECGNTIDLKLIDRNRRLRITGMLLTLVIGVSPALAICGTIWAAPSVMVDFLDTDVAVLLSLFWPLVAVAHPVVTVLLLCLSMRGPAFVVAISALCALIGILALDAITIVYFILWMMTHFGGC